jgi:hypothetical protein
MTQALRNMRFRALIIISFELIVDRGRRVLMWFYDFPKGFHDLMKTEYWMIALGGRDSSSTSSSLWISP